MISPLSGFFFSDKPSDSFLFLSRLQLSQSSIPFPNFCVSTSVCIILPSPVFLIFTISEDLSSKQMTLEVELF